MLLPLLVLWGADRLDWAMYASFGALSSIFGRTLPPGAAASQAAEAG
ncbi:hypothetical protein ACFONK_16975 [Microbacterium barkeri]